MPGALVFDAYGTLFDVHSVLARCEAFWPGKGAQLSQLWRAKQLEYTWQRSLMRRYVPFSQVTRDALQFACRFFDLDLDKGKTENLMQEYLGRGMEKTFDAVLSVDAVKIFKPAPQVYELAVQELKVSKEKIGFVSSNCWDAIGARSYGFEVWWINRSGAPVDRMGFELDRIVKNLNGIR